ncbi:hypothetical protein M9H77_20221 [Catharanthus roseus]|uniref:Uncharacterized protein n=1 Tax=Catharanthus roseus TaxID=4058 RepID=A0ACC0AJ21_CATRO|nr:hypothetical protein M9H77_20221 [Catharanthus roseus]
MVTQMEEVVDQSQSQSQSSSQDYKEENELPSVETEENVVKFLDSVDGYLMLMDSLNSTLRQGWLELASARHSMGASRINSALFDLKDHSAATTFEVHLQCEEPVFKLHKWASSDSSKGMSGEATFADGKLLPTESNGPVMSQNSTSENSAALTLVEFRVNKLI